MSLKVIKIIKILFPIGTLYPSQAGGPSNTIYWVAKALVDKKVEVSIVTTNIGAESLVEKNRWLSTSYGNVIYHSSLSAQLPLRMVATAARLVRRHDCVHLNSLFYPPSLIVATIAALHRKPIVWSCRGNLDEQALIFSAWKKKPVLWLIKKFLSGPRVIFHATSPEECAHIRKIIGPAARIVEIPNFMELPVALPHAAENPPYLLYVGRIHPVKALDNLLAALALSRQFLDSDFVLKIAGEDANVHGAQLKKQAGELGLQHKVQFVGHIEGEPKQRLYANARFTVLPSHTENFGNVVIESLAQGTPVIASHGAPWQMLETEKAGFWTPNDPGDLAGTIDKALNLSPDTYKAYRKNALSLVQKHFDIQANAAVWLDTYQKAIAWHLKQTKTLK